MAELKNNIVKLNRTSNETEKNRPHSLDITTTPVKAWVTTIVLNKSNCHELKDFKCAI